MRPDASIHDASPDVTGSSPATLAAFVGQGHVVAAVRVALDASSHDRTRFPHALFVGPPGLGKSNLVQIIANEMGVELRETLAQSLVQTHDLSALLLEAESRQILFIDEADEMEPAQQTLLYRALAEGKLFLPQSRSSSAPRFLPLEDFTLVMASNHESRLARPLVERFKMVLRFDFYSVEEVVRLLVERASALKWRCEEYVFPLVAERSRGVPRIGLRLLESVRRIARSERAETITTAHFHRMCRIDGIDARGLDRTERIYLSLLSTAGRPIRLNVLADRLGLPARTVAGVIESFLIRQGLVSRCNEGRELTTEGAEYVRTLGPDRAAPVPVILS